MHFRYIENIAVHALDAKIDAALKFEAPEQYNMKIGIENENGEVYRVIYTSGLGEFMAAVTRLQKLDMTDRLADDFRANALDGRFHFNG